MRARSFRCRIWQASRAKATAASQAAGKTISGPIKDRRARR